MPRKGQTMLYRPVPKDFPAKFIEVGWSGIEATYHAHAKTIKRWLEICGYAGLKKARAERVRGQRQAEVEERRRRGGDNVIELERRPVIMSEKNRRLPAEDGLKEAHGR